MEEGRKGGMEEGRKKGMRERGRGKGYNITVEEFIVYI